MKSFSANSTSDAKSATGSGALALFAMGWAGQQARALGPDFHVTLLVQEADGILRPQARHPADWQPGGALRQAATQAAEQGRPAMRPAGEGRMAFAVSLSLPDRLILSAAEGPVATDGDMAGIVQQMQWGLAAVELHILKSAAQNATSQISDVQTNDPAPLRALQVIARALDGDSYRASARIAATELARICGAGRVAIARARRGGAQVDGVSLTAEFQNRAQIIDLITAAANEALDQSEALFWPHGTGDLALSTHHLARLAQATGAGSVAAVPVGDAVAPWGVIVAEFPAESDALDALRLLDVTAEALAPLLEVKRRNDRFWVQRAWEGGGQALGKLVGPNLIGWKLTALVILAVMVAAFSVTAPARVTADAEITSDGRVAISAPFDGFLAERFVRAGDTVRQGQPLLQFDDRELQLERLGKISARRQKEIEYDAAIAENDRARVSVLAAEIAELSVDLDLTDAQIANARILAPFDGVVILDTTEGKIGAPLARGSELMALAPRLGRSVTLHVPDAGISRVQVGQHASLRLTALPDRPLALRVARITALTEAREGQNTFRVHAEIEGAPPSDLTYGMEGVAKIVTGTDLWVLTWARPLWEGLRLRLWSLWP